MEARRVVKIGNSLYMNLPVSIVEKLKVKQGDVLWIGFHPGHGAIISKGGNLGRVASGIASTDNIKIAADEAFAELRRKAKALQNSVLNAIIQTLTGETVKQVLIDLQNKRLELKKKRKK